MKRVFFALLAFTTAVITRDTNLANGFQENLFASIFYGAGHKITKLTIDTNRTGNNYLGQA